MGRVGLDGFGEILADGAFVGLGRIGGAHDFTVLGNRVVAFQHLGHDRTRNHEVAQVFEKCAFLVNAVKGLGLATGQPQALLRHNTQAGVLETGVDLARKIAARRVRLDDRKSAFFSHVV